MTNEALKEMTGFEDIDSFVIIVASSKGELHVNKGGGFYAQLGMVGFVQQKLIDAVDALSVKETTKP